MVGVNGWIELCWDVGRQLSVRRTPIFSFLSLQKEKIRRLIFLLQFKRFLDNCTEGDSINHRCGVFNIQQGCFTHLPAQQPVSWLTNVRHLRAAGPGQVGRQQAVKGQTRRTAHH